MKAQSPEKRKAKALVIAKTLQKNNMVLSHAAKDLGVSRASVQQQVRTNPYVQGYLAQFYRELDKAGATDKKVARVISEGLDAKKLIYVESGDSEEKVREEVKDHSTRLKSAELMLKIKKYIGDVDNPSVNVGEMKVIIVNGTGDNQEAFLRSPQRESLRDPQTPGEVSGS